MSLSCFMINVLNVFFVAASTTLIFSLLRILKLGANVIEKAITIDKLII